MIKRTSFVDSVLSNFSSAEQHLTNVIVEFGSKIIKLGYSHESKPRFIIESKFTTMTGKLIYLEDLKERRNKETDLWNEAITLKLSEIYFNYLLCKPEETRLVIIENPLTPTHFKQTIEEVAKSKFNISSVNFYFSQPMALIPLEEDTGIIVDVGYTETNVLNVVSGSILIHTLESNLVGRKNLLADLLLNLQKYPCQLIDNVATEYKESIEDDILDDIFNQFCYCKQKDSDEQVEEKDYYYIDKYKRTWIIKNSIRTLPCEILFGQNDEDLLSVAQMILESLSKTHIDNRVKLAQKIVIVGGCTNSLKGFKRRLLFEIDTLIDLFKQGSLKGLNKNFNVIDSLHFNHYILPWLGVSMNINIEKVK